MTLPRQSRKEEKNMTKDPVCGMEVDEKRAAATSAYNNKTYYFCAKGCKIAFDKEPEKYVGGEKGHSHCC
jgi:YHS domain-containing protein